MAVEGKKFGKYLLLKKIATGGMAEIFLARMRGIAGFSRDVCIKRIHRHLSEEGDFIKMFLDEARLMAYLNHPNIVSVYEFGKVGNAYYLALEYIHGVSLAQLIKKSRGVKLEHAIKIVSDVCAALHYAHNLKDKTGKPLNIVHRDVSPQNVLISYEGAVKMIDFGVAKATTQLHETRAGTFKGKYAYMSPEQCKGEEIDHRSDIFAVGIVLYETLTGKGLFHRENIFDTMEAVLNLNPPPVRRLFPSYPPEIDQIIAKAMAKDREKRYQTAEEMQLALEEVAVKYKLHSTPLLLSRYIKELFKEEIEGEEEVEEEISLLKEVEEVSDEDVELFVSSGTLESKIPPIPIKEEQKPVSESEESLKEWSEEEEDPTIAMSSKPPLINELVPSEIGAQEVKLPPSLQPVEEKEEGIKLLASDQSISVKEEQAVKKRSFSLFWITLNIILLVLITGSVLFVWLKTDLLKRIFKRETTSELFSQSKTKKIVGVERVKETNGGTKDMVVKAIDKKEGSSHDIEHIKQDTVDTQFIIAFDDKDIKVDNKSPPEEFVFQTPIVEKLDKSKGLLNIITNPDKADVWIDGKKLVEVTPIIGYELASGEHIVKIYKNGFKGWTQKVYVKGGEENLVEVSLEKIIQAEVVEKGEGTLFLDTLPYSEVFIHNKSYGYTPITDLKLKANTYNLTFKLPDGAIVKKRITLKANETLKLRYDFREVTKKGE